MDGRACWQKEKHMTGHRGEKHGMFWCQRAFHGIQGLPLGGGLEQAVGHVQGGSRSRMKGQGKGAKARAGAWGQVLKSPFGCCENTCKWAGNEHQRFRKAASTHPAAKPWGDD